MKKNYTFLFWLPVIIWASIIYYFSSLPALSTGTTQHTDFLIRKTAHFVEYLVLSILTYTALTKTLPYRGRTPLVITIIICVLYALSDEFHQSFTPGREPRFRDVFIDSIGISAALLPSFFRRHTTG